MEAYSIPLAALIVSITTLLVTSFGLRTRASQDYVKRLNEKLSELRQEIVELSRKADECERARELLTRENLDLLRRFLSP